MRSRTDKINGAALDRDPVLDEIVRRLSLELNPERIYLFGSRARDDADSDSDYDLMVVLPQTREPGYRLSQAAHALLWDLGASVDILIWNKNAFDSRLRLKASLPSTVVREGRLLYGT